MEWRLAPPVDDILTGSGGTAQDSPTPASWVSKDVARRRLVIEAARYSESGSACFSGLSHRYGLSLHARTDTISPRCC
jgi:hypothetical protein